MPTARGWAALGVATALLVLWIGFGEPELMTTAMFLIMAVAVGMAFVRFATLNVEVTRRIHPIQVHEGEEVVIEVSVTASRRIRNLQLEDVVHGLGVARFAAATTNLGQPLLARYEVLCRSRGIFEVGPAEVSVSDAFSLAERRNLAHEQDQLTIYPRVERFTGFPAVRGLDSTLQSTRPTFAPSGGEDFFTLREYQVGDDLRKVHWPSSAKLDALMIKQLEVPWQARALVLLDIRAERYPTEKSFEQAVRGAASAVTHLHQGGFGPELWTAKRAPALRSGNRYQVAMEMLATVSTVPHLDLCDTVSRLRRQGVGGGALIVVTGVPDDGVLSAYRLLAKEFTRTVVMAVGNRTCEGFGEFQPFGAVTVMVGPESIWAPAWRTAMEFSWSTASAG